MQALRGFGIRERHYGMCDSRNKYRPGVVKPGKGSMAQWQHRVKLDSPATVGNV